MEAMVAAALRWARACVDGCKLGLALVVLGCGVGMAVWAQDAPKRLPEANASNCAACHADKPPLPANHPSTGGMQLSACAGCHAKGSPASLVGKLPLSHLHQLRGLTCETCHADVQDPEPPKFAACLGCHTGESIFTATAGVKPSNPHGSPHYGKEADCNLCHHSHEKSENYCASCHKFEFKVP
jgi:cytochrome c3-like protein